MRPISTWVGWGGANKNSSTGKDNQSSLPTVCLSYLDGNLRSLITSLSYQFSDWMTEVNGRSYGVTNVKLSLLLVDLLLTDKDQSR